VVVEVGVVVVVVVVVIVVVDIANFGVNIVVFVDVDSLVLSQHTLGRFLSNPH